LVAYTNQLNEVTLYDYDAAMRKILETNASSQILRYTNDAAGDLLSLTDAKGNTTRWSYDSYGRVTNKLDQAGTDILRYEYDADNRLTNRWSAAMLTTKYHYDSVGNLTLIDYSAGAAPTPSVTNSYDALNRLTNMLDGLGTTTYTYTTGGQLASEDGPFGNDTVTNFYSNRPRTGLSLAQPSGAWTNVKLTYDPIGQLKVATSSVSSENRGYLYAAAWNLATHQQWNHNELRRQWP
jgi:YD repeat-containing protein